MDQSEGTINDNKQHEAAPPPTLTVNPNVSSSSSSQTQFTILFHFECFSTHVDFRLTLLTDINKLPVVFRTLNGPDQTAVTPPHPHPPRLVWVTFTYTYLATILIKQ